jgi:hypothetical protein
MESPPKPIYIPRGRILSPSNSGFPSFGQFMQINKVARGHDRGLLLLRDSWSRGCHSRWRMLLLLLLLRCHHRRIRPAVHRSGGRHHVVVTIVGCVVWIVHGCRCPGLAQGLQAGLRSISTRRRCPKVRCYLTCPALSLGNPSKLSKLILLLAWPTVSAVVAVRHSIRSNLAGEISKTNSWYRRRSFLRTCWHE